MNSLMERTLGTWLSKLGQSRAARSEARGYIGMIGALMALASLWMPFVRVWHVGISYFDLLLMKESPFPVVTIMILLAALFLYTARFQGLAFPTTIIYSIAFVLSLPSLFSNMMDSMGLSVHDASFLAASGSYVMTLGLILMIVSPFLWRVNEKIEILFQPQNRKANG